MLSGSLTFQEYMVAEPLPLATLHEAVLDFLRDRDDVVLFGALAVNAFVGEPRMTQDVDLISVRAAELATELRDHLASRFGIAVRLREIGDARGFRLYQVRREGNRHLVDVRSAGTLPLARRIAEILVMEPAELIAYKVIALHQRQGQPKAGTDWRDVALLLLAFPDLKRDPGPVSDRLAVAGANDAIRATWRGIVAQEFHADEDDDI